MHAIDDLLLVDIRCADHLVTAAEYQADAAFFHRKAAAYYVCGEYAQAYEQAKLAKNYSDQAERHHELAME